LLAELLKMDRTRRELIESECEKLSIAYARHVDFKEYDEYVDLFTEDCFLQAGPLPVEGKGNLKKAMAYRPDALRSRHVLTNIWIKVIDEDHATGISYLSLYRHTGEGLDEEAINNPGPRTISGPAAIGHYADEFLRTKEGWRIKSRILHFAFNVKN
jgi:hypothetical protein